jgi:hypothetical protein
VTALEREVAGIGIRQRLTPSCFFKGRDDTRRVEHLLGHVDRQRTLVPRETWPRAESWAPSALPADRLARGALFLARAVGLDDVDLKTDGRFGRSKRIHRIWDENHVSLSNHVVGPAADALDPASAPDDEPNRRRRNEHNRNTDDEQPTATYDRATPTAAPRARRRRPHPNQYRRGDPQQRSLRRPMCLLDRPLTASIP